MRRIPAFLASLALLMCAPARPAPARPPALRPPAVADRVEEDWELVVASTDEAAVGPQITSCMSAVADATDPFVALDMNYREYPDFQPGGLQVQVWDGQEVAGTATHGEAQLATAGEKVTWTQSLGIAAGRATYRIKKSQSQTWGDFSADNGLEVSYDTTAADLSGYSPDYSAKKTGATWQGDRVTSLTLVQVRYYAAGELVATDSTPRTVVLPD
jgi:hypothetical protein